jgi:ketosteroid isomerase-like protein
MKQAFSFAVALIVGATPAAAVAERADVERAIAEYNDALTAGDAARFRASLADQIFMFNGASSGDPTAWEAHMYVAPENLVRWSENFVTGAGPHSNSYKVLSVNVRANGAVVTTEDTGRNKYRSWDKMRVTWLVGKRAGKWKVAGFFIRDITNPK